MWSLLTALLACALPHPTTAHPTTAAPTTAPAHTAPAHSAPPATLAPSDWYYADAGEAIDWASVRYDDRDLSFRTLAPGLTSGPVRGASHLACGEPTRATLVFEAGALIDVYTRPDAPCVEHLARDLDWSGLVLGDTPLGHAARAFLVYDVAGEVSCTSCS